MHERVGIGELIGERLVGVNNIDNEVIIFNTESGKEFQMYHDQDCCEHVYIDDIAGGNTGDLSGEVVLNAYESSHSDPRPTEDDSGTWTFYWIATNEVTLVIRWYGSSNGYYGEGVDFVRTK